MIGGSDWDAKTGSLTATLYYMRKERSRLQDAVQRSAKFATDDAAEDVLTHDGS